MFLVCTPVEFKVGREGGLHNKQRGSPCEYMSSNLLWDFVSPFCGTVFAINAFLFAM